MPYLFDFGVISGKKNRVGGVPVVVWVLERWQAPEGMRKMMLPHGGLVLCTPAL